MFTLLLTLLLLPTARPFFVNLTITPLPDFVQTRPAPHRPTLCFKRPFSGCLPHVMVPRHFLPSSTSVTVLTFPSITESNRALVVACYTVFPLSVRLSCLPFLVRKNLDLPSMFSSVASPTGVEKKPCSFR